MRTSKRGAIAVGVALGLVTAGVTATTSAAKAARGNAHTAVAKTTPQGPFTVDMTNREDVRQFYYHVHDSANGVADGWNGSVDTCTPGTLSSDFMSATLTRINYYRAMAGVPSDMTFSNTYNVPAQAAALIMRAQQALSHDPPNTWACWTQTGHDGAAASNLGISAIGPAGIDQWMYDGGGGNTATGHRRWMLWADGNVEGYGAVPGIPNDFSHLGADALYVITPGANPVPTPRDGFWAWPPKGYVPYQVVYPRWSFNLAGADFTNASVTMTHNGSPVQVAVQSTNGGYGDPALVWNIVGINDGDSWPKPAADDPYVVTVSNVTVGGNAVGPFTYTVTIIDPSKGDAAHTPSGTTSPPVGQSSSYTVPAIPNATGYQWRTTPLTPDTLSDGAENGLGNWTANVGGYNPIQSSDVASGSNAFQLGITQFNNPETLTLNRTLLPSASSQLSFDSKVVNFDHLDASVQVSTDGGTNWSNVYDQQNGNEGAFSHKTVSLAAYAGQQIQMRFAANYLFDGGGVCLCLSSAWHFDNVALSNTQDVGTPVLSSVGASPSFSFNPASAGNYIIDVRPQYSNPTMFGVFSAPLQVTATGGACVGCPGAPTIALVDKGSGWVVVGFSPPSNTGTSAIISYTVTTSPGNQSVTVPAAARRAVLNVPNGTTQTATVAATNSSGTGPPSSASSSFTPSNTSVNVTTNYNAGDDNRLAKNATYFGQTSAQAQKTSVGVIAYIVGLIGVNPMTPQVPPVSSGPNAHTTAYSTSDQSALTTVMKKYGLSPTEAQYFAVMLVGYLLNLGGH